MLAVYLPMMQNAAVLAAGQLGLFEALARGPRTLPALARQLAAPAHGLERLVDLLVLAGWLQRRAAKVANTQTTQRWFTSVAKSWNCTSLPSASEHSVKVMASE